MRGRVASRRGQGAPVRHLRAHPSRWIWLCCLPCRAVRETTKWIGYSPVTPLGCLLATPCHACVLVCDTKLRLCACKITTRLCACLRHHAMPVPCRATRRSPRRAPRSRADLFSPPSPPQVPVLTPLRCSCATVRQGRDQSGRRPERRRVDAHAGEGKDRRPGQEEQQCLRAAGALGQEGRRRKEGLRREGFW